MNKRSSALHKPTQTHKPNNSEKSRLRLLNEAIRNTNVTLRVKQAWMVQLNAIKRNPLWKLPPKPKSKSKPTNPGASNRKRR